MRAWVCIACAWQRQHRMSTYICYIYYTHITNVHHHGCVSNVRVGQQPPQQHRVDGLPSSETGHKTQKNQPRPLTPRHAHTREDWMREYERKTPISNMNIEHTTHQMVLKMLCFLLSHCMHVCVCMPLPPNDTWAWEPIIPPSSTAETRRNIIWKCRNNSTRYTQTHERDDIGSGLICSAGCCKLTQYTKYTYVSCLSRLWY